MPPMRVRLAMPKCESAAQPVFGPDKPWLAPLAGYSDLPFRLLCREFGAAVAVTEMISARGLVHGAPATAALLANVPRDAPLVVQLFGSEPEIIALAMRGLRKLGYNNFDFNVGCPVRKVFRQHSGAALLDDKDLLLEIARAIICAASEELPDLPPARVGFKMRSGTRPEKLVLPDLALALEDLGANWLTVHPRFASQGYGGFANWEHIAKLARRASIPVLASGDLASAERGMECLAQTGASGLMYARGALYNPAIFEDHASLAQGVKPVENSLERVAGIIRRHIALARTHDYRGRGFVKMRSLIPRYVRAFGGAQELRLEICKCANWGELENLLASLPQKLAKQGKTS